MNGRSRKYDTDDVDNDWLPRNRLLGEQILERLCKLWPETRDYSRPHRGVFQKGRNSRAVGYYKFNGRNATNRENGGRGRREGRAARQVKVNDTGTTNK